MANPLTSLRKLGVSLVGDDGLLDSITSTILGSSPLDRMKALNAARAQGLEQAKSRAGLHKTAQDLETGDLTNEVTRTNLAQDKELFPENKRKLVIGNDKTEFDLNNDRQAEERRKQGVQAIGQTLGIAPEEAEKYVSKMHQLSDMGLEEFDEATLKRFGLPPELKFASKFIISLRQQDKQAEREMARIKLQQDREDSRETRADARVSRQGRADIDNLAKTIRGEQQFKDDVEATNRGELIQTIAKNYEKNPNAIDTQTAIVAFNKVIDSNSVVREAEFDRTGQMQSWIVQAKNALNKASRGGFTPDIIKELNNSVTPILAKIKERSESRFNAFRERAKYIDPEIPDSYLDAAFPEMKRGNQSNMSPTLRRFIQP